MGLLESKLNQLKITFQSSLSEVKKEEETQEGKIATVETRAVNNTGEIVNIKDDMTTPTTSLNKTTRESYSSQTIFLYFLSHFCSTRIFLHLTK